MGQPERQSTILFCVRGGGNGISSRVLYLDAQGGSMNKFGTTSNERLDTCDYDIQKVMRVAVKIFDISVIWGHRGRDAQNKAYVSGNSKLEWPNSKHNKIPSQAIDIIPYPSGWPDKNSKDYRKQIAVFYFMGGVVMTVAWFMRVKLRWGADWDSDNDFSDNKFDDLAHFEKIE